MTDLARRCGRHPEELAVDACARCGTFICLGCRLTLRGLPWCQSCAAKAPPVRHSTLGTFSLVLSAIGFFGSFAPALWYAGVLLLPLLACAPIGVVTGVVALARIRWGKLSREELPRALTGALLGLAAMAICALLVFKMRGSSLPD